MSSIDPIKVDNSESLSEVKISKEKLISDFADSQVRVWSGYNGFSEKVKIENCNNKAEFVIINNSDLEGLIRILQMIYTNNFKDQIKRYETMLKDFMLSDLGKISVEPKIVGEYCAIAQTDTNSYDIYMKNCTCQVSDIIGLDNNPNLEFYVKELIFAPEESRDFTLNNWSTIAKCDRVIKRTETSDIDRYVVMSNCTKFILKSRAQGESND